MADTGKILADAGNVMNDAADVFQSAQKVQQHLLAGETQAAMREWCRTARLVRRLAAKAPHKNDTH